MPLKISEIIIDPVDVSGDEEFKWMVFQEEEIMSVKVEHEE